MVTVTQETVCKIMLSDMTNVTNKMKYVFESCGVGEYYTLFYEEQIDLDTLKIMETKDFVELGVLPMDEVIMRWINNEGCYIG